MWPESDVAALVAEKQVLECVLLRQNVFSCYRMCSLAAEHAVLPNDQLLVN